MQYDYQVHKFPMEAPDDTAPLAALFDTGQVNPAHVISIIAKTEGNGRVNDYTRSFAAHVFAELLAERRGITSSAVSEDVSLVMSGGCEGVMSPHATVVVRIPAEGSPPGHEGDKRLVVGVSRTRALLPEELGTTAQVDLVAQAVAEAQRDAGIEDPDDVHYVQVKCPLLTSSRIAEARERGQHTVVSDTTKSMGYSNGASGLGVAVALGEVDRAVIDDGVICTREDLYSTRGSSSSGIELMKCEAIVFGNSARSHSGLRIGHSVLTDLLDADAVRRSVRAAMGDPDGDGPIDVDRVVQAFAKGLVSVDGRIRGWRTTLLTDSDLGTRPARAVLNATVACVLGDPAIYASAGWGFHQGPAGGGVVASIVRVDG